MDLKNYKKPLKTGNSLEVFSNEELIFESRGKWLEPLFEAEQKATLVGISQKKNICFHDTAIGKAAAVLMIRMGAQFIHGDIVSRLALDFINDYNKAAREMGRQEVVISYENLVDRLMCATEAELAPMSDFDSMYFKLRQRAKLVCGVSVKVSSINYSFGNICDLSFELGPGGHLMVVGENGAGKTTLLRLLAGIYKPVSGEILIDGVAPGKVGKFTIGYIPQQVDDNEFSLSVEEVVGLGLKGSHWHQQVKKALERVAGGHLINRAFCSLSGGEKQKVSIARCLAQKAKLLLLDEPTSALDKENRKIVIDIIRSLTVTEIPTIIISTHDRELAQLPGWEVLHV